MKTIQVLPLNQTLHCYIQLNFTVSQATAAPTAANTVGNDNADETSSSGPVSFADLPEDCLTIIWKFIAFQFVALAGSAVEDQFVDLKSLASFRLVNRRTDATFQSCQGWLLFAKAP